MDGRIVSGERSIAQSELQERVARAAGGFARLGATDDSAVTMMLRNDFAFLEAAMAAALVGAYAVPINWHFRAEEAGHIMRDCGARVLVIHADLLPNVDGAIPENCHVFVVPTPPEIQSAYGIAESACGVPDGMMDWNAWLAGQPVWTEPPRPARTNMIYTSGTTGAPKGVRREPATAEMQTAMGEMVKTIFGFTDPSQLRTVITGPVYHSAPNFYALYAAQGGQLVILQPRFDPEELLRMIERHRITHVHMVPTMFVRLLKLPQKVRDSYDLSSLQFVAHAAAPCPPEIKRRMIEWWGPIINEYYGGTETGGAVFHTAAEALAKPCTVGRAIANAEIRILDASRQPLPAGEIGEVFLRIHGFPDFTYNNMDDKRREVEQRGLITCGDVGYLDEDGYLFLCDRVRDMVISGGVNIYPAEIEASLIGMPGVRDCAVFGIPDEEFGERLCAYVEPEGGVSLTGDDVRDYLRQHLANYKIPRVVEFSQALPREDSGKIFKRKLRAPYWEQAGRQI